MLRDYVCPDCGTVVGEGSTSCVRCGCPMSRIKAGIKAPVLLPYTQWAGHNDVKNAPRDKYGNPNGTAYDLLRDGSMKGYTILIISMDASEGCGVRSTFSGPVNALENKGFQVLFNYGFPSNFDSIVQNLCQIWLLSGPKRTITDNEINKLVDFYNSGRGLYLWSDNEPYFADTNPIISKIFGSCMSGRYTGNKVIGVQKNGKGKGIVAGHLISTGIANFYEGITISNVKMTGGLCPLVYSSDGNVVTAYFDGNGKRILVDGGYTRLYYKWDSAGTDRYIVNAAGWLGNFEKFGWKIPD